LEAGTTSGKAPADHIASSTAEERELTFTFGAPEPVESRPPSRKNAPRSENKDSGGPLATDPETGPHDTADDSWVITAAETTRDQSVTATTPQAGDEKIVADADAPQAARTSVGADPPSRETAENIVPISEFRDQAASTVPYLTLFGLLIIFFFFTTAYLEAHPKVSESVVRRIPLLGPSVLKNSYLKNGVLLKSLRAAYQTVEGNREVLVVSGEAVNQNPVMVRQMRVLGQLYNAEGKAVEKQVIWLGNALSPKIIRGMSPQDIADLQRLPPLKSFEVPPGDSVSFAIVFLRPAKAIKDFSCEVVSAEGEI
jgi:hypothetical protein